MMMAAAAGKGGAVMQQMGAAKDGASLVGTVKRVQAEKGFGFISCPDIPQDVYFKLDGLEADEGASVSFTLTYVQGRPQARNVDAAYVGGEVVEGIVKSYSDRNKYGFIKDGSERDIYFSYQELPEDMAAMDQSSMPGTHVQLTIKLNKQGKPTGTSIVFVAEGEPIEPPQGAKRPAPAIQDRSAPPAKKQRVAVDDAPVAATGNIKSYNAQKGWGFITSDAAEKDVWFKKDALPEEIRDTPLSGEEVAFHLTYSKDGKPQAADITMV